MRKNSKFEMRKLEIGECGPPSLLTRYAEELGPLRPAPPIRVSHSMTDGNCAYAGEFEGLAG